MTEDELKDLIRQHIGGHEQGSPEGYPENANQAAAAATNPVDPNVIQVPLGAEARAAAAGQPAPQPGVTVPIEQPAPDASASGVTGGGQPAQVANELTKASTGETQPVTPAPVVVQKPVAKSPAEATVGGAPPVGTTPQEVHDKAIGLQEALNTVDTARQQLARGPQDINAQSQGQILDAKSEFYKHSLASLQASQNRIDDLTQKLATTGNSYGDIMLHGKGDRGALMQQLDTERANQETILRGMNGQDPTEAATRAARLEQVKGIAEAALSPTQRDDETRAKHNQLLNLIDQQTHDEWTKAAQAQALRGLTTAQTGTEHAKAAHEYAGAGLERAEAKAANVGTDYKQNALVVSRLLQSAGDKDMTPQLEQLGKLYAPELHVPAAGGFAETPEQAKAANEYTTAAAPILDKIRNAISVRNKDGVTVPLTAKDVAGKALSSDLKAAIMNDESIKRMSPEAVKLIDKQVPDVGSMGHVLPALQTIYEAKRREWESKTKALGVKSRIHPMPLMGTIGG